MLKLSLTFLSALSSLICLGQTLSFDFENLDTTGWHQSVSLHWEIDTINPISGKASLHQRFDNPVAGLDFISYSHDQIYLDSSNASWQFAVKYNYNPSSANNWSVWLINSLAVGEENPGINSNAYILGVNYQGTDDILRLWKKTSEGVQVVLATSLDWEEEIAAGKNTWLRIDRKPDGKWEIFIDTTGNGSWNSMGNVMEKNFQTISHLGVYYKYSSTQDRKLWIDDIEISGKFYRDIYPPAIDSIDIPDRNSAVIFFNEPIDTLLPLTILLNETITPDYSKWSDNKQLTVVFQSVFSDKNKLLLDGLTDNKGNVAKPLEITFTYYQPRKYDVIFTEILADPTPSVGLPECEFIELYNRSQEAISVKGWKLFVGSNFVKLPDVKLNPGAYYILAKTSCSNFFGPGTNRIELSTMPALINTGSLIRLSDCYNQTIDAIEYLPDWYLTEEKREGGWSLELIDNESPCMGKRNWTESTSPTGGTPGFVNSVAARNPDSQSPEVTSFELVDSLNLRLSFSKPMDSLSLATLANFSFPENNILVVASNPITPFFTDVLLRFSESFITGVIYHLQFAENGISDCSGNNLITKELTFGIPEEADSSDVLLNEILFESNDFVPEYIEIYNNSSKIIDLKTLRLLLTDGYSSEIKDEMPLTTNSIQLYPNEYFVVCENKERLISSFNNVLESKVQQPASWMTLSNEGGYLSLLSGNNICDKAVFNKNMQFDLLNSTAGVSLERISFEKPANKEPSWHSAAESAGYGTPTLENSQLIDDVEQDQIFNIEPEEISPDNDGFQDLLSINYFFSKPGYTISSEVFSIAGMVVKQLANNELCGTTGTIVWDGLADDGSKLPMGYYVVFIEAVHPEGELVRQKHAVLVLPEKK